MVYTYLVTLKNDNRKYIDLFSLLICSASALIFLREQLVTTQKTIVYLVGFIFIAVLIARNLYLLRTNRQEKVAYNRALFFAAIVWTVMPDFQWLVFVFGFLGLFDGSVRAEWSILCNNLADCPCIPGGCQLGPAGRSTTRHDARRNRARPVS